MICVASPKLVLTTITPVHISNLSGQKRTRFPLHFQIFEVIIEKSDLNIKLQIFDQTKPEDFWPT